jgi:putative endonuclease
MLGEWLALQHLERRGYVILEKNWRGRRGEIDLIALESGTLIFIEVKCRAAPNYSPFEAIGRHKQDRLKELASAYQHRHRARLLKMRVRRVRFDTIGVLLRGAGLPSGRRFFEVIHKQAAFE